jgi:hypothetical protein
LEDLGHELAPRATRKEWTSAAQIVVWLKKQHLEQDAERVAMAILEESKNLEHRQHRDLSNFLQKWQENQAPQLGSDKTSKVT